MTKKRGPETRPNSNDRGYDAKWRQLRALFLKRNPKCCFCSGTEMLNVDHIKSVAEFPELRLVWSNLRTLCHSCHSRRTMLEQDPRQAAYVGSCGEDGLPTDDRHPWNSGTVKSVPPRENLFRGKRSGLYRVKPAVDRQKK